MESSGERKIRKTKAVLAVNSNQTAGEHWEDTGESEKIMMNRVQWKAMVEALCLTSSKEAN